MISWANTDATNEVSCPKCDAIAGESCQTPKGRRTLEPHTERLKLYRDTIGSVEYDRRHKATPTKVCPNCNGSGKGLRTVFDTFQRCLLCDGKGRISHIFTKPDTPEKKQGYWLMHAQLIRGHKPLSITDAAEKRFWKDELTPVGIFLEDNVAVRVAKIYCYGVERFLKEGKCKYLNSEAGYDLIALQLLDDRPIVALKMVCPSTNTMYIIPVPPYLETVPEALDWYFQIDNYLGRVGVQT